MSFECVRAAHCCGKAEELSGRLVAVEHIYTT